MKTLRNTLFLGSALALAACGGEMNDVESLEAGDIGESLAPLIRTEPGKAVPGAYIVKFKDGVDSRAQVSVAGVQARFEYSIINGFAADLTPAQVDALRRNPNVEYVEEDGVVTLNATQTGATWGIDRIDQVNLPLSTTYNYTSTASNVYAYVIDTGTLSTHTQFGGRAVNVYDAITPGGSGTDCNGHGTHVAGTVGGSTYGVAKGVRIRGVRVLDCAGSGTWSQVIAGMDWVRLNHVKPAVANMSLGGSTNASVNTAATELFNAGVFVAVAAGNNNALACNYSPAGATAVMTVAATTNTDARATYSNYGSCVDIYAPGSSITSAWYTSTMATSIRSGTSMSSAHVAGVAALYLGTYGGTASSAEAWIKENALRGKVTGNPAGTPNLLLNKGNL